MNNPIISIIVPVFNNEKYIGRCLNSIKSQIYRNIEVIIIDDGSSDNTSVICKKFLNDNRFKYYYEGNRGPSFARNEGLKKARGQWVMFVDSDDFVSKWFCEDAIVAESKNNADIVFFRYAKVCDKRYSLEINRQRAEVISKQKAFELMWNDEIGNYAWNKLYKKDLFDNLDFEDGRKFEDLGIMYKLIEKARNFVYVDEVLYFYFQRGDSIMHTINNKDINDAFEFRYEQFVFIKQNYPVLVSKALPAMMFNSIQVMFHKNGEKNYDKAQKIINDNSWNSDLNIKYKVMYLIAKYLPFVLSFIRK